MKKKATWGVFMLLVGLLQSARGLDTEHCKDALGMENGNIPDEHITASSSYDVSVDASKARARKEHGGGAWCPKPMVDRKGKEYLEISLGSVKIVTKVEVQGRFGNSQGKEYAENYKLHYWRPGLQHWSIYKNGQGEELLDGNTNTYLAKSSQLSPPVIASRVRFVPYSKHPRAVCMRVEVYGCPYKDGLISYSMDDGDPKGGDPGLQDLTYDGLRQDGYLSDGLGQLSDGETGHTNFRVDTMGQHRGYEWVGWKNSSRNGRPVEIIFEFDTVREFKKVHFHMNNLFSKDIMVFSHARVYYSVGGKYYHEQPMNEFTSKPDRIFEYAREVTLKMKGKGKYVKLQLYFARSWIMVSEITFDSVPCECNMTEESAPKHPIVDKPISSSVVPARESSSGLVLGTLVTIGVIFIVVPLVLGAYYYKTKFIRNKSSTPPSSNNGVDTRKVSMKMKDLHINMNLSPASNGYSRAKGNLYGHVAMDEEMTAMYQEPYKGPVNNLGYYTMGRPSTPCETPLKMVPETDDSTDYAVPDLRTTPPPPFSEIYTPPPPVPLSCPPTKLLSRSQTHTPPPVPPIPPPPEQQYYTAPHLCQPSNIQSVTGSVLYSVIDKSGFNREPPIPEIPRHRVRVLETLGQGGYGFIQLCEIDSLPNIANNSIKNSNKRLVAMKSLKSSASENAKKDFRNELQILNQLNDPNIVRLVGVVANHDPLSMLLEYMDRGDLYQFLSRHDPEDMRMIIPHAPNGRDQTPTLSYGALVYIGSQIASGMKYLEAQNIVHRDLATRNCLVGEKLQIKISDFGMSQPIYTNNYYRLDGLVMLPIRWMAWESILQGRFTTKSDVWAFGVTLWEILTLVRRQPYDELSDEGVLENVSHCYHGDSTSMMLLPQPALCPKEMYDMMAACWRSDERQRPPFWEIFMFLQRKNLGYTLDYSD